MLEPTTRRIVAVLQQWDGRHGYAETAQGAGYHLHREHLEQPQPVWAGMNVEIYLDENGRGETERMVFRPVPLAGEDTAEARLPEHGHKLYADGKMSAWQAVRQGVLTTAVWYGITAWLYDNNWITWQTVALLFCAMLLIYGLPLLYRRSRPPVWVDNEQSLWLDGSMVRVAWAAQGRAYYFFDWRDIYAIRERRSLFGREYWVLTVRRSAVVQASAGDAAAREATRTEIKFYPDILSRADRDTVRQCFNSFACRK